MTEQHYTNEVLTGALRWQQIPIEGRLGFSNIYLQQEWKCWNCNTPLNIEYIWRDCPLSDANGEPIAGRKIL